MVNGQEIVDEHILKENDRLTIGLTEFTFTKKAPIESAPKAPSQENSFSLDPKIDDIAHEDTKSSPELTPESTPEEKSQFDDLFDKSDDIPDALIPDAPNTFLKVIGGPNTGAEISLTPNKTYTLGKSANDCDIVFQDLSVSKTHAKLTFQQDKTIEIEDLGSKNGVKVNDKAIDKKTKATIQDVISLGTTSFLIIDQALQADTIFDEPPIIEEEKVAEVKKPTWKDKKIPPKFLVLGGAFATTFIIIFMTFFSLIKSVPDIPKPKANSVQLLKQCVDKEYPTIHFSITNDKKTLLLAGHINTPFHKQELLFDIKKIMPKVEIDDKVVVDEHITTAANKVLAETSIFDGVSIFSPQPGCYVVQGYLASDDAARALNDYILTSFPYPDKLTQRIYIESELLKAVAQVLYNHGLAKLSPRILLGHVTITGGYTEEKAAALKKALSDIEELAGIRTVKNMSIVRQRSLKADGSPIILDDDTIDISNQYLLNGVALQNDKPYNAVINGRIFMINDIVDGMTIVDITRHSVILEKESNNYVIKMR